MTERSFRARLADGGAVVGTWLSTVSPVVAELLAGVGFDFVTVDAEHAAIDLPQAQSLFQAVTAGAPNCIPLVRLPSTNYEIVKRYLDIGAGGVIAPHVNTAAEAEELVNAVKYPPEGRRGVGFARSNAYGMAFEEAVPADNDETFVCIQIEHIEAVRNINKILEVDGVDAGFVGPYDLSASLELTGEVDHPDVQQAIDRVRKACQKHDVTPGMHVVQPDPDKALRSLDKGYRIIAYSLDVTMLAHFAEQGLAAVRSHEDVLN